jgi:hypothetical protein
LNSTPDRERSTDRGAETLQHFQYQHSYISLLAIRIYAEEKDPDSDLLIKEIVYEHHEDALGITKDNRCLSFTKRKESHIKDRARKSIPSTTYQKIIK